VVLVLIGNTTIISHKRSVQIVDSACRLDARALARTSAFFDEKGAALAALLEPHGCRIKSDVPKNHT